MQISGYEYEIDYIREYHTGQGINIDSVIDMESHRIRNLANPIESADAVTLEYGVSTFASKAADNIFTGQNQFNGLTVLNEVQSGSADGIRINTSDGNHFISIGTDGDSPSSVMNTLLINTPTSLGSPGGSIVDILVEDTYSYNHGIRIEGDSAGQNTSWIHLYDYDSKHRVKYDYIGASGDHTVQHIDHSEAIKEYAKYSSTAGETYKVIGGDAADRMGTALLTVNGVLGAATQVNTPIVHAVSSTGLELCGSGGTPCLTLGAGGGTNATFSNGVNIAGQLSVDTISPTERVHIDDGYFLVTGTHGSSSTLTASGAGTRCIFYPRKSAFRAGFVNNTQWDNGNIGEYSTAMGARTIASGYSSTAMGRSTTASGNYSTAIGYITAASGIFSTAMGRSTTASGVAATAMGYETTASGDYSTAMGDSTQALADYSTAMGYATTVTVDAVYGTAMGFDTVVSGDYATAMGYETTASAFVATAMGRETIATGSQSTAMGYLTVASGDQSTAMGILTEASEYASTAMGYETTASGNSSTAMGRRATASGAYSFAINLSDTAGPSVGANTFRISNASSIGGNLAWTNHSDRRLKKDINSLTSGLDKVKQLQGVSFKWRDEKISKRTNLGLIAQDVEQIVPEAVHYDRENDTYSVEYTALVPVLIEAIKEQNDIINTLKNDIDTLKDIMMSKIN
jgi:hypothetical protein